MNDAHRASGIIIAAGAAASSLTEICIAVLEFYYIASTSGDTTRSTGEHGGATNWEITVEDPLPTRWKADAA
jgi:hypothetical protein